MIVNVVVTKIIAAYISDEFRANSVEWNETPEKPNNQIVIKEIF